MDFRSLKNRKVLVTGHTGFKGSWLTLWLLKLEAKVIGLSLEPETQPNLFTSLGLEKQIRNYFVDIRDAEAVNRIIKAEKPEVILHLAAQPLVRRSYRDPVATFATNAVGTMNILESLRINSLKAVMVNVTTDKCYKNLESESGYSEEDALGGYDPYSASKACSELITSSYRDSFFNPKSYGDKHQLALASARAGNVIGGGDWSEDRLIPDCIRSLVNKEEIILRNPSSIRPWQFVLEPLAGYLLLATKLLEDPIAYSSAWNFGPDAASFVSVEKIVHHMIDSWAVGSYRVIPDQVLHETKVLKLNTDKAEKQLGFVNVLSVEQCLDFTIQWYKNYYEKNFDIQKFSLGQITEYERKLETLLSSTLTYATAKKHS